MTATPTWDDVRAEAVKAMMLGVPRARYAQSVSTTWLERIAAWEAAAGLLGTRETAPKWALLTIQRAILAHQQANTHLT